MLLGVLPDDGTLASALEATGLMSGPYQQSQVRLSSSASKDFSCILR